jgi:NAD(P)-dependent dehydrogenase (short-subunit alcohol dehydrogenase family)
MSSSLSDRVVVITGASSGVGRACVRTFARRGARLGLLARNMEALEAAAREARETGTEALALHADVADAEAVERAAAAVEERFGRIDVWVNCAMATVFAPVVQTTPEEYRRVTEVTYLGFVYGTLAALRRMRPRDEGHIIQIGSALAYRSIPLQSAYCAAKAAIRGFTDSLRTELIHEGSHVRLSMLQLPAVNTPQSTRQRNKMPRQSQPVPPQFSPETIAEVVLWAAEHPQREMLIGWPTVKAVVGQKVAPWLLDRLLGRSGYQAQLTDIPNQQAGRDILFQTLPGDPGAHGPYRERERGPDLQIMLRTLLGVPAQPASAGVTAAVAAAAMGLLAWSLRR